MKAFLYINISQYTYGAPKVGLTGLAQYLTNTNLGATYRVTHKDDPVPRLPPALLGYRHPSPEYYITSGNDAPPTTADINRLTGLLNLFGNEGNLGFSVDSHVYYFGPISACEGRQGIELK